MTRPASLNLDLHHELIVDLFAGGGGMSTSIEQALGRAPDVAINHDDDAISMHRLNHPAARHYVADVYEVDPPAATHGRLVGLLHLSPDCTHHSQAAAGQPRDRTTRALSWVAVRWAGTVSPRVITLENVRQILQWGPLIAKRDRVTGRVLRRDGTVAAPGERVPLQDQFLIPDPRRRGRTWYRFLRTLKRLGYQVEHRLLNAADYGAPTTRERLFLVARRDGRPITWPAPTHARQPHRGLKSWRAAAECIDWSLPCSSIFDRPRPLAEATLRRIAIGIQRFVIETAADPFVIDIAKGSRTDVTSLREPLGTVTAWPRGGSRALISAVLAQANGGYNAVPARSVCAPLSTISCTGSQQQLVTAHLATLRRGCIGAAPGGAEHHSLVEGVLSPESENCAERVVAFLMKYYGTGVATCPDEPCATITTRDRLALVTVSILVGIPHVIVDVGLRMLQPAELYRAQGFPPEYVIDRGHDGRVFSKATQVRLCGNSISPPPAAALIRAVVPDLAAGRIAA